MATLNLNYALTWTPSFNPFLDKQQTMSTYTKARSVCKTTSSQDQPAPLYGKTDLISNCKNQFKSSITAPPQQEDSSAASTQGTIRDCFIIELV
jgi:hypothetical protein